MIEIITQGECSIVWCSELWRMYSTVEDVQNCGGCSVLWWRMFSIEEGIQYCGGSSVLWRMFSIVGDFQYCGGMLLVMWGMFSTFGNVHYCGGYHQYIWLFSLLLGDTISSLEGCHSVLCRMFTTVEDSTFQGISSVVWGATISSVEVKSVGSKKTFSCVSLVPANAGNCLCSANTTLACLLAKLN